jgi:hypothetical protein
MDWYHDTEAHLFDDVAKAADEAADAVLEQDRIVAALLAPDDGAMKHPPYDATRGATE